MKKAWIEDNIIRDIAHAEPFDIYHPDVAKFYDTEVSDDAENGDTWENGELIKQVFNSEPEETPEKVFSDSDIRENLSLLEKVKWDNDSSDFIKTAKMELFSQPNAEKVTPILQMLVDSEDISEESMQTILSA